MKKYLITVKAIDGTGIFEFPTARARRKFINALPKNTRWATSETRKKEKVVMKKLGFIEPIILEKTNQKNKYKLLGALHRIKAIKKIGLKKIPTKFIEEV